MNLDNLINELRREMERAQERADHAGTNNNMPSYHQNMGMDRAFKRAIEIVERYSGTPFAGAV